MPDISSWASLAAILCKWFVSSSDSTQRHMVSACPSLATFIWITWLRCHPVCPLYKYFFLLLLKICEIYHFVWGRGFAQYLQDDVNIFEKKQNHLICDCLSLWGFNLLFSSSNTNTCHQIQVNLTVFEKHNCDTSRNSQMNLSDEYRQILHIGKDDSLMCHLNFPKSCDLDSVKWYKVKKMNFPINIFFSFSLKPTCLFSWSHIF